jgi:CBS-domain-containing membrane protein
MLVMQLMSYPVTVCYVGDNLSQAARLMADGDRGALPVLDDIGRVIGMVTDRDICLAAYRLGRPLAEISVRSTMSSRVYSCGPEDPLGLAEQLMRQHQVRRLPVVDPDGRPVGVLSLTDLARAACGRHPLVHGLSTAGSRLIATARTWASVCAPRTRLAEAVLSAPSAETEAPSEPVEPEVRWEWRSYGPMACGGPVGGRPSK